MQQSELLDQQEDENLLALYMHHHLFNNQAIEENSCARRMRFGFKLLSIIHGITAGIPYIGLSCKAGQGNIPLCVAFSTGNVISYGGATVWAGLRLTKLFDPVSKQEKRVLLSGSRCSPFRHLVCNMLGILASIPGTYVAYKYNTGNGRFLAISGFFTNYIFSTLGYYEITESSIVIRKMLSRIQERSTIVKASDKIKEYMINQISNQVIPYILTNRDAGKFIFPEENIVYNRESIKQFIEYIYTLPSLTNNIEPPENWRRDHPRRIFRAIFIVFPFGAAIVDYLVTNEAANLMTQSPVFSTLFSVISTISSFSLNISSTTETAGNIFDSIYNTIRKRNAVTVTSSFYPKTNLTIIIFSTSLACLSVAGAWQTSSDVIANSQVKFLINILPAIVYTSSVLFESFGMRKILHDTINYVSSLRKNNVGEVINKINKLEKFISIISNCIPSIIYDFWNYFRPISPSTE